VSGSSLHRGQANSGVDKMGNGGVAQGMPNDLFCVKFSVLHYPGWIVLPRLVTRFVEICQYFQSTGRLSQIVTHLAGVNNCQK
jgi:hypothetical protein